MESAKVTVLPTSVCFEDITGKAHRVVWSPNGYHLSCSCAFAHEKYNKSGVYYCSHVQRVLTDRQDKLDSFKTVNPVMEQVVLPVVYDTVRKEPHALIMELPAMADGSLEVWFHEVRIHDAPLGYVRPTDSRAALIEMARPYLIEYHLRTPCVSCGEVVPVPALRTADGQTKAVVLAMQVLHSSHRMCSACRDLIPDI